MLAPLGSRRRPADVIEEQYPVHAFDLGLAGVLVHGLGHTARHTRDAAVDFEPREA